MLFQYLLILSFSLFITVKCCLPKWQTSKKTILCKTPLDCPQKKPHICKNGICTPYNALFHRKTAKMNKLCSTFLDCLPGLTCSNGQCIKEQ
ncbi:SID1 transmembrane family member [Dirofilaria immitis]